MILYHIITTYHLFEAMVHRMRYHKEDEAILVFPDFGAGKFPQYAKLKELGFFDNVYLFPYENINHGNYEEDVVKAVNETIPYSLFDMEKIYVAGAQFYFSYYLIANNIPFYFFEEAGGNLTRPEDWIITMNRIQQYDYAIKYGLMTGDNRNVIKRICNLEAQKDREQLLNVEDFSITKELASLESKDIDLILEFFDVPKLTYKENSIIIMTQHFAGLKMMTYEEQMLMYSLSIDYFAEEYNLVFKCHPDDIMAYGEQYKDAQVIREKFPAELLTFASEVMPKAILTISSTGVRNVASNYSEVYTFDVDYQNKNQYYYLHKYYVANMLVGKLLDEGNVYLVDTIDCIVDKFEYLAKGNKISEEELLRVGEAQADILVVDKCMEQKALESAYSSKFKCIIFINSMGDYCFANRQMEKTEEFVVKELQVSDSSGRLAREYLYIHTLDEKIKEVVYKMEAEKKLKYSDLSVNVINMDEKDEQISILRGQLEAAQERLKFYIEKYENDEE